MDDDNIKSFETQLRKGLLTYCILSLALGGQVYTSKIIEELKSANMIVTEGTLYPLLNRLSKNGFLNHVWEESSGGPPKKYYSISKDGRQYLKKLDLAWKNISVSINKIAKEK
ncbi:MAG TPA: PadR family transcriptional regulator [Candidatus Saccharibacteria bacterium]|jgi:PadR family transcriptional regulator PadR|nr:PadR family transcriptional regulator [Candidatus Saccharibacteria bacterium]